MTKHILKTIALSVATGLIAILAGCKSELGATQNGLISGSTEYPLTDQLTELRSKVQFEVKVPPPLLESAPHQQWFFNGFPIDSNLAPILGVTGYTDRILTIEHARLINCGFYSYQNENDPTPDNRALSRHFSATAQLIIVEKPIEHVEAFSLGTPPGCVVYGTPIAGGGGVAGNCPGKYVGYAEYQNPNDPSHGWRLANTTRNGKAYANSANAEVYYIGVPSTNWGCSTNIPKSVYPYHFRIYFKQTVPPGPYGLNLVGFKTP